MADPVAAVIVPDAGTSMTADRINEMNSKMLLFHPALEDERRGNPELCRQCFDHLSGDVSIAALFESIVERGI